jgi:hypothetical protein
MSTERQQNVNITSTGHQQDINMTSTGYQQDINRMSTSKNNKKMKIEKLKIKK